MDLDTTRVVPGSKGSAVGRACLLVTSWCALVQAQSDAISWRAPAACPDRAVLLRAVSELVGPLPQASSGFQAVGSVTVAPDGKFQLDLQVTSATGSGTRSVSADDCDTLVNVAAFGIALALNPDLAGELPAEVGAASTEVSVALEPGAEAVVPSKPRESAATPPVRRRGDTVPAKPAQGTFAPVDSAPRPRGDKPFVAFASVMPVMDMSLMPKPAGGAAVDVTGRGSDSRRN